METPHPCGVIMSVSGAYLPRDPHGCRLTDQHEGPHECVDPNGTVWQWETDWECDCDHCTACEGDYCILYWEASNQEPNHVQR